MDILSELLTDKLWDFSTSVGYGIAVVFGLLSIASFLHDDRSIRRLMVAIFGLVISVALIGQQIIDPAGPILILATVIGVMVVMSLLFELVPFMDNFVGRLSHIIRKITLLTGIYTVVLVSIFILPFSYLYLYGFSYPPCGLSVSHANYLGSDILTFEGNRVAYLTWTKGGRFDHKADFCSPVFDGTKGKIAETILPGIYENNKRQTSGYRMESPIEQGEIFKVVSLVSVECGAGACRDFDEGMYYVLKNGSNELWVASAEAIAFLQQ